MNNSKYVKSDPIYDEVEFNAKEAKAARTQIKRKMPTSVSLPEEVVNDLKKIAEEKGIPYQVLMRSFILDGLKKIKASA